MNIDPKILIIIVVAVVAVVAVVLVSMQRKRALLKSRFGPEYERTLRERGSESAALNALAEREKRVEKFKIRELEPGARDRYAQRWREVQSQFVDDPKGAVVAADDAVAALMGERGYPMADFDQRAADLSVSYPNVVQNYRAARDITVRHRKGQASTEDLRQAMIHYRSLFDELLSEHKSSGRKEVA